MQKLILLSALLIAISFEPTKAENDLCSYTKSTIAAFQSKGWGDNKGALFMKVQEGSLEDFESYNVKTILPGFDRCSLFGTTTPGLETRRLSCSAKVSSVSEANAKVNEIADQLRSCLPTAKIDHRFETSMSGAVRLEDFTFDDYRKLSKVSIRANDTADETPTYKFSIDQSQ